MSEEQNSVMPEPIPVLVEIEIPEGGGVHTMHQAFECGIDAAKRLGVCGVTFEHLSLNCRVYADGSGTAHDWDDRLIGRHASGTLGYTLTDEGAQREKERQRAADMADARAGTVNDLHRAFGADEKLQQSAPEPASGLWWPVIFIFAAVLLAGVGWLWANNRADSESPAEWSGRRIEKQIDNLSKTVAWARKYGLPLVRVSCDCDTSICKATTAEVEYTLACADGQCQYVDINWAR